MAAASARESIRSRRDMMWPCRLEPEQRRMVPHRAGPDREPAGGETGLGAVAAWRAPAALSRGPHRLRRQPGRDLRRAPLRQRPVVSPQRRRMAGAADPRRHRRRDPLRGGRDRAMLACPGPRVPARHPGRKRRAPLHPPRGEPVSTDHRQPSPRRGLHGCLASEQTPAGFFAETKAPPDAPGLPAPQPDFPPAPVQSRGTPEQTASRAASPRAASAHSRNVAAIARTAASSDMVESR